MLQTLQLTTSNHDQRLNNTELSLKVSVYKKSNRKSVMLVVGQSDASHVDYGIDMVYLYIIYL